MRVALIDPDDQEISADDFQFMVKFVAEQTPEPETESEDADEDEVIQPDQQAQAFKGVEIEEKVEKQAKKEEAPVLGSFVPEPIKVSLELVTETGQVEIKFSRAIVIEFETATAYGRRALED